MQRQSLSPVLLSLALTLTAQGGMPAASQAQTSDRQIETRLQQVIQQLQSGNQEGREWEKQEQQRPVYRRQQQQLKDYRQVWQQKLKNPTVTSMLGRWMGPFGYTVTVFPTASPDRVCLEFTDEETTGVSVAQVRGNRLQTQNNGSTVAYIRYENAFLEVPDRDSYTLWPSAWMSRSSQYHQAAYVKYGCITETNLQVLRSKSVQDLLAQNQVCVSNFRTVRSPLGKITLYTDPTTTSAAVGTLSSGAVVRVEFGEEGWVNVTGPNDVSGWMPAQFLLNPRKSPYRSQMRIRTVDGDPLNVRATSSPGDRIVGSVPSGTIVTTKGYEDYRTQIVTDQGLTGFVPTQYLDCR